MDCAVHVALAFCDPHGTYCRHAAVTLASVFANVKQAPVCVHIVHDETLSEYNKNVLKELAQKFGQKILFYDITSLFNGPRKIDVSRLTKDGGKGTLFRLFLPELVQTDKIIYLDCDIIVQTDIAELWQIPLGNSAVAAVPDVWALDARKGKKVPWRLGKVWNLLGVSHDSYFNAGVLVLNLKKIRRHYNFLDLVERFYAKYKNCVTLADQDCLNWIFSNDKLLLEERFNRINTENITEKDIDGCIWHMAGGSAKPWSSYTRPMVDDLYWHYLRLTPYCTNEQDLIHAILSGFASSNLMHLHSRECVKRLLRQLYEDIFKAHLWTVPYILLGTAKMYVRGKLRKR